MTLLFFVGLTISMTSAYTVRVFTRNHELTTEYYAHQSQFRQMLGASNLVSILGILLWGFVNLAWYIPIILFVVVGFIVGYIFGRDRLFFFFNIQPFLDVLSFIVLLVLWIKFFF